MSINTVTKLLVDAGKVCHQYQLETMRDLKCQRLQCDEILSFVDRKAKNIPEHENAAGIGNVWTWTAIDADTKLVPSFLVGARDIDHAIFFMQDLAGRLAHRAQLTMDGQEFYMEAVGLGFHGDIDYAMLINRYGKASPDATRYSPAKCTGCDKKSIPGNPDPDHISTSYVERQNLTLRMSMRRFTRPTNTFSKKIENHEAAVALHFMYYNFVRRHQTLHVTPAMAAGVDAHMWSLREIVDLIP